MRVRQEEGQARLAAGEGEVVLGKDNSTKKLPGLGETALPVIRETDLPSPRCAVPAVLPSVLSNLRHVSILDNPH